MDTYSEIDSRLFFPLKQLRFIRAYFMSVTRIVVLLEIGTSLEIYM